MFLAIQICIFSAIYSLVLFWKKKKDLYFLHIIMYILSNNLINEKLFLPGLLTVCVIVYLIF